MKRFNSSKIFFYTGNHNTITGIADIIDYFKNICAKNNISLKLSSKLPKSTNEIFVIVEEFSKPNQYLKINQKLDSIKAKKILVLTEFFNHKDNNLNSFITPKKFRLFIKTFGLIFVIFKFFSIFIKSLIYKKEEFNKPLKLLCDLLICIFLSPFNCIRGFFILIKYYIFFGLLVIHKISEFTVQNIYYILNPTTSLKSVFFIIDILNMLFFNFISMVFSKKIFFKKILEFKIINNFMINIETRYKNNLFVKYLRLFFEKYDNSNFTLSSKEYEFYKKIIWTRQFIVNYVFYYNMGLNNNIKIGILFLIRPTLDLIKNFYFFNIIKKYILPFLSILNFKKKSFQEYLHNYVYFKIRYLNLMKCINKFDYILRTHEEIKVDKDIINVENDVIFFSQFEPKSLNKNFKFKKFNFDFSGQFNTYRHKKIKEIIENFKDYSNIFSTEKLNEIISKTNNNEFISSKKSYETKFSLHIEKSETWPYSSPARYINSLQKNEIPIIIKNFGDLYSSNMAINLEDLIKHQSNINNFIKEYFKKIIVFKKQIDLNDNKIVENLR